MAGKQALKVFRTPIGFHDAYVAAPSQKAALKAWGSDADLFARGFAERVEDPALTKEPLARPGEVIKRLRGTAEQQIASLPPERSRPVKAAKEEGAKRSAKRSASQPKSKPRPSRTELQCAEEALVEAERRQANARRELDRRIEQMERDRRQLVEKHEAEAKKLQEAVRVASSAYDAAMEAWQG